MYSAFVCEVTPPRPITITQPPLGRVVEVLLQVEGFEPEALATASPNLPWYLLMFIIF